MKRFIALLILLAACFAPAAWAQSNVTTTGGTTDTITKFTGPTSIGDSVILENYGNIGIRTYAFEDNTLTVFNTSMVQGEGSPPQFAVYARVETPLNASAAVRGDALATSGGASGVIGLTWGLSGGVLGGAMNPDGQGIGVDGGVYSTTGGGGVGVHGHTATTTGTSFAVSATAEGTTGGAIALFAESRSPQGYAGYLVNRASGNILVGAVGDNTTPVFRVDGRGTVHANGGFRPFGADFAESMPVTGDRSHYEPGDLLAIDPTGDRRLNLSNTAYSTLVAGIYSTRPGVLASPYAMDDPILAKEVPMAVVGIVPCKVSAENGPILVGDLLVTSSTPGHAMKGTDRSKMLGAVVGKALESLREGTGVIQVLVTLQ